MPQMDQEDIERVCGARAYDWIDYQLAKQRQPERDRTGAIKQPSASIGEVTYGDAG